MKETFNAVMRNRAAKFTADVKAGKYRIPPVELHRGNQSRLFKDGDEVRYVLGYGPQDTLTIVNGANQNGYWSYALSNGRFARQDDLRRAT